ncbi:hypothetical protein BAE44_0023508, partial [Dichanthelium oligosanthes]
LPHYRWYVLCATEGYLAGSYSSQSQQMVDPQYFTLNLKTLLLESLCAKADVFMHCHLYASFPPPFSLPSIRNGKALSNGTR